MRPYLFSAALLLAPQWLRAQIVHPAGAPTTTVNWQSPVSAAASFRTLLPLDLNSDGNPDVVFTNDYVAPTGAGSPTRRTFTVNRLSLNVEVAVDSTEFDSAKRFQAGQIIRHGIRWGEAGGYLDYEIIGNGGTGGRGFFRDGVPGYVVARMAVGSAWHYWWIYVASRSNNTRRVDYFGVSQEPALGVAAVRPTELAVYPNPAATVWRVRTNYRGPFQLFDTTGRLATHGQIAAPETALPAAALPAGLYHLLLGSGATSTLVKE